ncbi:N-carbamoyl-L-amino acid hydrolase [Rhodovastum atsumiense]|uniref:Allantoate amidohydrolase n=1 Tax=Rhodovastum atsumiense TaxID=504468 RepID=A0A5M6ISA2_9PROT|nr:allantoate amidohydrolase [Rhodovastum atsumiense]KAA5611186.1 allantoate amidohydrolase [Rhodovastum atsumiense]CAH2602506.1 N-carbamoyl-L-amino acid hydrolase [Rhodovastum atsumiense]
MFLSDDPLSGAALLARIDALAAISQDPGRLTRLYLTPEHRHANDLVAGWMRAAGMAVREDAAGNVVGRYEGRTPGLPALLLGSHLDTVRDAGRFDGMLGVVAAIAVVEALHRQGRRLDFAIEVIGFWEEEGARFQPSLIGSSAVAGTLACDPDAVRDADGVTLAEALRGFGLDPAALPRAARSQAEGLAYVELHIEQGPVLEAAEQPVGIVTAIAGATRSAVTVAGRAGHAGTVPMELRCDAMAAAAEMILAVEAVAAGAHGLVATVGQIAAEPGAINVIPGRVRFTVDLRAGDDALRAERMAALRRRLHAIATRRHVTMTIETLHDSPAAACDAGLMRGLAAAVRADGIVAPTLASGAGHDAMALAKLWPMAMLFVRCAGGISHHPAESVTAADAETGARVLLRFVETFTPGLSPSP